MTPHLEEGLLQELIDGEIPSTELPPIQAHLASCAECRERLTQARELAAEADLLIGVIEPPGKGAVSPAGRPQVQRSRWGRNLAWAATVVIAAGTGFLAGGQTMMRVAPDPTVPVPVVDAPVRLADSAAALAATPAEPTGFAAGLEKKRADAPAARREARSEKAGTSPATDASSDERVAAIAREAEVQTRQRATGGGTGGGTGAAAGTAAPPPPASVAARAAGSAGLRLEQSARANEIRLDEQGKLSSALKRDAVPAEITFPDALGRLGGTLRLIEGLVPVRLEALDGDVRVVYPLASGELVLEQRLAGGRVTYRLVAPGDFPTDSLARLLARVRE